MADVDGGVTLRAQSVKSEQVILLYIDPGAGSMVIQAVLAAALAIPFFLRTHIRRFVQRLRGARDAVDEDPTRQD